MSKRSEKSERGLSYRAKWLITLLTMVIAMFLVSVCSAQGMFTFTPGSVKANDKVEAENDPSSNLATINEGEISKYTVFVTAGNGGSSNPDGSVSVDAWGSITLSFIPDEGYRVQNVIVDSEELGAMSSYTLSYITSDHTIMVTFEKAS